MTHIRTLLHRVHAPSKAESGQAMVETAASAMILATLLMGGIDVGRYTYDGMILGNAARAGVQYGAQNFQTAADNTGMQTAASKEGANLALMSVTATQYAMCDGTKITPITQSAISSCSTPATIYVSVTTTGAFKPTITFPGIPNTLTITRTNVMQVSP